MAAEIFPLSRTSVSATWRFNEAAANGRGNRASPLSPSPRPGSFNEAAANGRGNQQTRDLAILNRRLLQ